MAQYIGVDIGGTKIHVGLVDHKGKILKERFLKTEAEKGSKKVLANIFDAIDTFYSRDVSGIGIGCPGPLDIKRGRILDPRNLPLHNFNLRQAAAKKYRVPVFLDNDANCFALGEAIYGAGKGRKIVVAFTMGTGIGGGIVIEGKILHGRNNAGELGHMVINKDESRKRHGHKGCLESYIGKLTLRDSAKGLRAKNPYDLYVLSKKGNKKARKIWQGVGSDLGIGIANMVNILDPDVIVIGGNVAGAWEFFRKSMEATAKEKSMTGLPRIAKSKLGSQAAVIGAARLAMRQ